MSLSLSQKLSAQEVRLVAALEESRATYKHPGLRGSHVEAAARSFLNEFLPRKLTVGRGEIIDLAGRRSAESDIIVANEDQPFHFPSNDAGLYIAEGVSAVGEVKSRLTSKELDDTLRKGRILKKLQARTTNLDVTNVPASDINRFYECPGFFLLAFESSLSIETLNRRIFNSIPFSKDGQRTSRAPLDAVFVLGHGYGLDLGDGDGRLRLILDDGVFTHQSHRDWSWLRTDRVLVSLLMWLNAVTARAHKERSPSVAYLAQDLQVERLTTHWRARPDDPPDPWEV